MVQAQTNAPLDAARLLQDMRPEVRSVLLKVASELDIGAPEAALQQAAAAVATNLRSGGLDQTYLREIESDPEAASGRWHEDIANKMVTALFGIQQNRGTGTVRVRG